MTGMADTSTGSLSDNATAKRVPGTDYTYYYTGYPVYPSVHFEIYQDGEWKRIDEKNYDVTYGGSSGVINPGNYSIHVLLKNNYSGELSYPYTIANYTEDNIDLSKATLNKNIVYLQVNPLEDSEEGYDYIDDVAKQLVVTSEDGKNLIYKKDWHLEWQDQERGWHKELYVKGKQALAPLATNNINLYVIPHAGGRCNYGGRKSLSACFQMKQLKDNVTVEGFGNDETDEDIAFLIDAAKKRTRTIDSADIPGNIVVKDSDGYEVDALWEIHNDDILKSAVTMTSDNENVTLTFTLRTKSMDEGNRYFSFKKTMSITCPHHLDQGEVHAPNCIYQGYTKYTCTECGHTYTDDFVPANGVHTPKDIAEEESTCTKTGHTAGVVCSVCGKTLSGNEVIPIKDHSWVTVREVAPTCGRDGSREQQCSVCKTYKATEKLPATGEHTFTEWAYQSDSDRETCTKTGRMYRYCPTCFKYEYKEIPALGHAESVSYDEIPATCESNGLTGGTYCSRCHAELTPRVVAPATGHSFEVKEVVEPTCKSGGYTVKVCTKCKWETYTDYTEPIEHEEELVEHVDPTCVNFGWDDYCCKKCGDQTRHVILQPYGHNFVNGVCTRCGETDPDYGRKDHDTSSSGSDIPDESEIDITTSSSSSSKAGSSTVKNTAVEQSEYDASDMSKIISAIQTAYNQMKDSEVSVQYAGKKTIIPDFKFVGTAKGQTIAGTNLAVSKFTYKNNKKVGDAKIIVTLKATKSASKAEKKAVKSLNKQLKVSPFMFKIVPRDISTCNIKGNLIYNRKKGTWKANKLKVLPENSAAITLKYNKKVNKSDFTIDGSFDTTQSEVKITGNGNFTAEKLVPVTVK